MQFTLIKRDSLDCVVIDGLFSDCELGQIMPELLDVQDQALTPMGTGSATDYAGECKKHGRGIWLDGLYGAERDRSPTLSATRKIFSPEVMDVALRVSHWFQHIGCSTKDTTLVNYYSTGGGYKAHTDACAVTSLTLLGYGKFTGGGLRFEDADFEVAFSHNRTIIFPGCTKHEALPIEGGPDALRISIAKFMSYI